MLSSNSVFPARSVTILLNEYQHSFHRRTYGMCRLCPDTP